MRTVHTTASREQEEAVDLALEERAYQDKKWGGPEHDDTETPEAWAKYITEYANGTGRAANYNFAKRMQKVAALSLAALEAELRRGNQPGDA